MKNNGTKERLFEITGKLDKTFNPNPFDRFTIQVNRPDYQGTIKRNRDGWMLYDVTNSPEEAGPFGTLESLIDYYDIDKSQMTGDYVKNLPEAVTAAQTTNIQQTDMSTPQTQYADSTYKMIAPTLQRIRTVDQFPMAFKGWFSALGYKPQSSPLTIAQVRIDVEQVMRELGYK
jgi:hypothetical protein